MDDLVYTTGASDPCVFGYATMYQMLDARTRQKITPEKIESAFTHKPGEPGYELFNQLAEGKPILTGRPASFQIKMVRRDKNHITADYNAMFMVRSKNGMNRDLFYIWLM